MTLEEYQRSKISNNKYRYLYDLLKRVLITTSLVLMVLISCNLSIRFKTMVNKYVYETNYNFSKINSLYKKYILKIQKDTKDITSLVSKNKMLEYTKETKYKDGVLLTTGKDYAVKALNSGLVLFVGEREGMNIIEIEQSNGIDVIYGNIKVEDIKVYDYIEEETIIGSTISDDLYLSFKKEGETLDYKPYIQN